MINFESEVEFPVDFDPQEVALLVCDKVLDEEQFPYECEIEILLTDENTVKEINSEYRNIDNTTDVLSFPNIDWDSPADYECAGFNDDSLVNPDTENIMLGQIVLCKERIFSQAKDYGHSVKREYAFLIAHSMLHLLGYDHMEADEAKVMEAKQGEYLDLLGIKRG